MKYIIYKITNKLNGKIYIGKHQTQDLNDSYMGSGKYINHAIKKHGKENFIKDILYSFDTEYEMNAKEAELVTEEFCNRDDTYNICSGGRGGFSYINRNRDHHAHNLKIATKRTYHEPKFVEWNKSEIKRNKISELHKQGKYTKSYFNNRIDYKEFLEKANSPEAIQKRRETWLKTGHNKGKKNSQYGTKWITDGKENKKIKSIDDIPNNWYFGRTCL